MALVRVIKDNHNSGRMVNIQVFNNPRRPATPSARARTTAVICKLMFLLACPKRAQDKADESKPVEITEARKKALRAGVGD